MEILVVGYDDSQAAKAARSWATQYARDHGAEIRLAYVISSRSEWELAAVPVNTDSMRGEFQQRLRAEWSEPLRGAGVRYGTALLEG